MKYTASRTPGHAPTIIVVGCNKGDDFMHLMQIFSGNKTYSAPSLISLWDADGDQNFICGRLSPLTHGQWGKSSQQAVLPITGYCIEPLPATFAKLTKFMASDMRLDEKEIRLVNAAMSDLYGTSSITNAPAGTTKAKLSSKDESLAGEMLPAYPKRKKRVMPDAWIKQGTISQMVPINVTNLDKLISDNGIFTVDFLSIDAEGG